MEDLVDKAIGEFGAVDVMVNNAGYSHMSRLLWKISLKNLMRFLPLM